MTYDFIRTSEFDNNGEGEIVDVTVVVLLLINALRRLVHAYEEEIMVKETLESKHLWDPEMEDLQNARQVIEIVGPMEKLFKEEKK